MADYSQTETPRLDSRLLLLPGYAVFFGILAITALVPLPPMYGFGPTHILIILGIGAVARLCSWLSIYVYYTEHEKLDAIDALWVPNWKLYAAGAIFVPVPTALVYLIQRWRHV